MTWKPLLLVLLGWYPNGLAGETPASLGEIAARRLQAQRRQIRVIRHEIAFVERRMHETSDELGWQLYLIDDASGEEDVERAIRSIYERRESRLRERLQLLNQYVCHLEKRLASRFNRRVAPNNQKENTRQ